MIIVEPCTSCTAKFLEPFSGDPVMLNDYSGKGASYDLTIVDISMMSYAYDIG